MGIALTIYNLYELKAAPERYLLVRAERPEFPNWDEGAADAAIDAVGRTFATLVASQRAKLGFIDAELIGTWEDAYPRGDIFYSDETELSIEIWFAMEAVHGKYVAFGIANTEDGFWESLRELHEDGDLWGFDEFIRPPVQSRVWLVQQATEPCDEPKSR